MLSTDERLNNGGLALVLGLNKEVCNCSTYSLSEGFA